MGRAILWHIRRGLVRRLGELQDRILLVWAMVALLVVFSGFQSHTLRDRVLRAFRRVGVVLIV